MYVNQLPEMLFIFKSGFMGIGFHMHVCLYHVHLSFQRRPERVSDSLELELPVVVSYYVGAGN